MSNLLTISYGDTQEGADALEAVLKIMADAGVILEIEAVQLGAEMVKLGFEKGFDEEGLHKIRRAGVLLTAPTQKNVVDNLRAALGDEVKIFATEEAMEMLRYLEQGEVAARIADSRLPIADS